MRLPPLLVMRADPCRTQQLYREIRVHPLVVIDEGIRLLLLVFHLVLQGSGVEVPGCLSRVHGFTDLAGVLVRHIIFVTQSATSRLTARNAVSFTAIPFRSWIGALQLSCQCLATSLNHLEADPRFLLSLRDLSQPPCQLSSRCGWDNDRSCESSTAGPSLLFLLLLCFPLRLFVPVGPIKGSHSVK